ncbi:MAG: CHAT domain-containing protein [Reichenbachiella sp.]
MKRLHLLWCFCVLSLGVTAQSLDDAERLLHSGEFEQAKSAFEQLSDQYYNGEDQASYAHANIGIAECELGLGKVNLAIVRSKNTIDFVEQYIKEDSSVQALCHMVLGNSYLRIGRNDLALENLTIAETFNSSDQIQRAECLENIGVAYWNNGNKELSLDYHKQAYEIRKSNDVNEVLIGDSNLNIGLLYLEEKPLQSLIYFNRALKSYQSELGENHPKIALCYSNMAFANAELLNYDAAFEFLDKVSAIWNVIYEGAHPNKAFVLSSRGRLYKMKEDFDQSLVYYQEALTMYLGINGTKHPDVANMYFLMGQIYQEKRDYKLAVEYYQKSTYANLQNQEFGSLYDQPEIRDYYNADILLSSLQSKAKMLEVYHFEKSLKMRDIDGALGHYLLCDELITQIRQIRIDEMDKLKLGVIASDVYERGISISKYLNEMTLKPGYYESFAFDFSEKSKAAVLQEAINDSNAKHFAGIPDAQLQLEDSLKDEIGFFEQMLVNEKDPNEILEIEKELFAYQNALRSHIQQLESDYPEYYDLKFNSSSVTLSMVQDYLKDGEVMLTYFIGSEYLYSFAITNRSMQINQVSNDFDLEKKVLAFRNAIKYKMDDSFESLSMELYDELIPDLGKDVHSLFIIPDGVLSTLPFEALIRKTKEGNRYLVEDWAVGYGYSSSLFMSNKGEVLASKSILLTAPVNFSEYYGQMANLPGTKNEVKEIKYLFMGEGNTVTIELEDDATETAFKGDKSHTYDYIHLATHGKVNESNPAQSRIYLAPNDEDDGNLYCGEIYGLSLNANLVTLSACETGLGKISKGEGVLGLSRALMYAGAKNLLVSLWSVNDNSTSELMVSFYKNHLFHSTDNNFSDDLQKAKLEMIRSDEYSFPYYWAPFVLVGK